MSCSVHVSHNYLNKPTLYNTLVIHIENVFFYVFMLSQYKPIYCHQIFKTQISSISFTIVKTPFFSASLEYKSMHVDELVHST